VGGQSAAYAEAGAGRTVVFLHGWGVGHRAYRGTVKRLAATGVHVIAPALPGFGGAPPLPAPDASLDGYAAWVLDFLDAVGVTQPVLLVGHSFGGGVAIMVALQRPDLVGALVLVNSIGGTAITAEGQLVGPVARRLWDWGVHFARDARRPSRLVRVLPVVVADGLPNLLRAPRTFLRSANVARQADLSAELATLAKRRLPIVVLWGHRDHLLTDASVETLRELLSEGSVITVSGGHNWLLADPAHFGEVMTNVVAAAERARWLRRGGRLRRWWRRRCVPAPRRRARDGP